jgi:16S rRNA (adenine1518-N6/adenine1519-N6)-dimethyltransferase
LKITKKTDVDKKLIFTINEIFSYRRKTIKNILKQFGIESEIEKRVDDLTGDEIVNLAKQIIQK